MTSGELDESEVQEEKNPPVTEELNSLFPGGSENSTAAMQKRELNNETSRLLSHSFNIQQFNFVSITLNDTRQKYEKKKSAGNKKEISTEIQEKSVTAEFRRCL